MDTNQIIQMLLGCITVGLTLYIFLKNREAKTRDDDKRELKDYTDSKASTGKIWVDELKGHVERSEKYNTQQFEVVDERLLRLEKGYNTLNSQLMTEHKVDSKLEPIKDDIEETKKELIRVNDNLSAQMKELRTENKEANTLQEMHTQQLFSKVANIDSGVARLEGYLRAKSEGKLDD